MTAILSSPLQRSLLGTTPLTGTSQPLFPKEEYGAINERFIYNPNAAGSFWINLYGGTAAVNGQDCVEVPPGGNWVGSTTDPMTIIGTAGLKHTAGSR